MNNEFRKQLSKTRTRFLTRNKERDRNIWLINHQQYFDIDSPARVKKFLERRNFGVADTREIMAAESGFPKPIEKPAEKIQVKSLERILGTNDLVDISFLYKAIQFSKTVGRIWLTDTADKIIGYGTGFMISPVLMITNHHVLPDIATASGARLEMNYEFDANQVLRASDLFRLEPTTFFVADEELDYAIVAVAPISSAGRPLSEYGFNTLIREEGKTIISQWLNVIEHPNGLPKQIGLRENQLIDVLDDFLHYKTDTAPGASGSPVFNEEWEVVGLHHSGVYEQDAAGNIIAVDGTLWNSSMGEDKIKWVVNEGVRISSILKHMDSRMLTGREASLYQQLFTARSNHEMPEITGPQSFSSVPAVTSTDGSVTVTVPLSVTFRLGNAASSVMNPVITQPATDQLALTPQPLSEAAILQRARQELAERADVLHVRMGYVFENGWITRKRAIVVTVPRRKPIGELVRGGSSPLPATLLGYPIEVSGPTIEDLIRFEKGPETLETLINPFAFALESRYFPPADAELKKVQGFMKVNANVSPEQGWRNLQPFLEGTERSLTVGMYDFGSLHILNAIASLSEKGSFEKMTMAIQVGSSAGEGTKKDDLQDAEMVEELGEQLGPKFRNAWVRIGTKNGWVPSSYHIKTAVRDGKSIFLSSGSWQSSNQPDLDKLENATQSYLLKTYNRDWHVLVENEQIAATYEKFLLHDYENNKQTTIKPAEESMVQELFFLIPALEDASFMEEAVSYQSFAPFHAEREFTVTPLLSPDNYFEEVLALVQSATEELFIQNQTFNAPKPMHEKLRQLTDAVLHKQQEGVDVRIIFRNFIASEARKNLEALVELGFDPMKIRMHDKCHTKGIMVDGKKVLIGSQNWSNDGVSVNRDASLLFEDEELTDYFKQIFLHDWEKLAKNNIGRESLSLQVTNATDPVPAGMVRVGWSDILEML
ncbi:phospholipase D-like domain-containing protein [Dyadobacter crusticola]|uniref:phospholipase D-like domain-containing protein n=1 Tax=Dyadobacter crusticola TaxID=292407 RepID=UPI00068B9B91|nr:phospholipase D-like domain-containing protein [Dyadobacter crusticola]